MTVNNKLLQIWKAVCGKAVPDHATKANGRAKVQLHSFLTSVLERGE